MRPPWIDSTRPPATSLKRGVFDAVPEVDQSFNDGYASSSELFQVKAEIDEVLAGDFPATDNPACLAGRRAGHQIETHSREALFQVEQIRRIDASEDGLSDRVDCFVGVQGHQRSASKSRALGRQFKVNSFGR